MSNVTIPRKAYSRLNNLCVSLVVSSEDLAGSSHHIAHFIPTCASGDRAREGTVSPTPAWRLGTPPLIDARATTVCCGDRIVPLALLAPWEPQWQHVDNNHYGITSPPYASRSLVAAILLAEERGNSSAARHLGVTESTVRGWRKCHDRIFQAAPTRKAFRGPKTGRFPKIEEDLAEFVRQRRGHFLPVNAELVQIKARELAREAGDSSSEEE
ncbi:hypothetical protein HPB52_008249 [Rhipicephalus sanguineus]|uniref:Uncharacterized protein n=1 Tax=Rhipicephalus sanguineus TaxID=34632 RepID=A0A9D4Q5L2_RHISA|nr:hypothetical protein HPB52_008249 [Rhipicephalus sanguineus]